MMLNLSAEGMSSEVIAPFGFTWDRDNLEKAKQYSFDLNVSICTTRWLGNLPRDRIDIPEKDMRKTHRSDSQCLDTLGREGDCVVAGGE